MEILKTARALLEKYPLCDSCLGRQFALLAHGLTNQERGRTIKLLLILEAQRMALEKVEEWKELLTTIAVNGLSDLAVENLKDAGINVDKAEVCHLCLNVLDILQDLAEKAAKKAEEYEHETFLVGVNVPPKTEDLEDELRAKFNVKWGESIRNELSREIGKRIEAITEKTVDYRKPDILIVINPFTNSLALNVRPLFIAGRYRKLVRGIPQSRWVCTSCNGKGCPHCDWKGKMYSESVEELIGAPLLKMTVGTDTRFHAAGREDVDARVLGPGRPFIIEVKKPKKRTITLKRLEKKIAQTAEGKAEASDLKMSSKEELRKIKAGENAEKVYRAVVEFEREVSDKDIALLENSLTNNPIRQLTPLRVLHRRADKMRERRILETKVKRLKPSMVEMLIRCQGGLYIKELITGDQGRTSPNVSTLIGVNGKCIELDVMDVRV